MIIWKGYGILVLVISFALCALLNLVFSSMGLMEDIGVAVGALISGISIWFVGNKFNATEKTKTLIDKQTGQEFTLKPDHSLFFIKMQYWAFIIGGLGLIMLIGIFVNGTSAF